MLIVLLLVGPDFSDAQRVQRHLSDSGKRWMKKYLWRQGSRQLRHLQFFSACLLLMTSFLCVSAAFCLSLTDCIWIFTVLPTSLGPLLHGAWSSLRAPWPVFPRLHPQIVFSVDADSWERETIRKDVSLTLWKHPLLMGSSWPNWFTEPRWFTEYCTSHSVGRVPEQARDTPRGRREKGKEWLVRQVEESVDPNFQGKSSHYLG